MISNHLMTVFTTMARQPRLNRSHRPDTLDLNRLATENRDLANVHKSRQRWAHRVEAQVTAEINAG
jgi:hypothetical protein